MDVYCSDICRNFNVFYLHVFIQSVRYAFIMVLLLD